MGSHESRHAVAVSKSEGWCRHQRAEELQTMERLVEDLFGGVATEVSPSSNCGGHGEEYYATPTVTVEMQRGVNEDEVEAVLIDHGWHGDSSEMISPDGAFKLDFGRVRSPEYAYPFVSAGLRKAPP